MCNFSLDGGGQGGSNAVMANQAHNCGEPPTWADGSLRHPDRIGEPKRAFNTAYDQPHRTEIAPAKSTHYRGPLEGHSAEEIAAMAIECIKALDGPQAPPKGLPGTTAGYDPDAFYLMQEGVEYYFAWLSRSTRSMVNICESVAEKMRQQYWRGKDVGEQLGERLLTKHIELEMEGRQPVVRSVSDHVYFIQSESGGIKIGVAVDVAKRLRGLQTAHPAKLTLLAVTNGGPAQEADYHRRFAAHRLHGEWFERHPDILAEIDRLNAEQPA